MGRKFSKFRKLFINQNLGIDLFSTGQIELRNIDCDGISFLSGIRKFR